MTCCIIKHWLPKATFHIIALRAHMTLPKVSLVRRLHGGFRVDEGDTGTFTGGILQVGNDVVEVTKCEVLFPNKQAIIS